MAAKRESWHARAARELAKHIQPDFLELGLRAETSTSALAPEEQRKYNLSEAALYTLQKLATRESSPQSGGKFRRDIYRAWSK